MVEGYKPMGLEPEIFKENAMPANQTITYLNNNGVCSACRQEIHPAARVCHHCGSELMSIEERRADLRRIEEQDTGSEPGVGDACIGALGFLTFMACCAFPVLFFPVGTVVGSVLGVRHLIKKAIAPQPPVATQPPAPVAQPPRKKRSASASVEDYLRQQGIYTPPNRS